MRRRFADRGAAGRALAGHLTAYSEEPRVLVLGLVRGGVPVAAAVAERLRVKLDVLVVRKLGVPEAPEVAFGAVGAGDVEVVNQELVRRLDRAAVREVIRAERAERDRRERLYRGDRPPLDLRDRTAVIVDDGFATGATALVAVAVARRLGAVRAVVAAPVGSPEAVGLLHRTADQVVCPLAPDGFGAVSRFYDDFTQVADEDVVRLLTPHRW